MTPEGEVLHGIERLPERPPVVASGRLGKFFRLSARLDQHLAHANATSVEDMAVVLHNRLALTRPARARQDTPFGRWLNRFLREDPDVVPFNGIEIDALLGIAGMTTDIETSARTLYSVPYESAVQLQRRVEGRA